MGYGGKTANGLSSLGPKMGGKAHGGGVKIEKNKISQSQDNVLSGKFTSMGSAKIVGKGMMKYLAGEPVGMGKYKSNAQRKAAHASMAEQGAGKYGKHMGPEKPKPDYIDIDGDGNKTESMKEASDGMGKYGKHKGPKKEKVKSVSEIKNKKDNYSYQEGPKPETLKSTSKPKSRKPSKEIAKSKIEEGKKLKKEGRQEKRDARKDARKAKRSARLDKKIALQEFKGKQKAKAGDQLGAQAKQNRVKNLKARKAKK